MKNQQDRFGLCPLHHPAFCGNLSRRGFLEFVAVAGAALGAAGQTATPNQPAQPPAKKLPVVKVAYVRHAAAVCGGWPGHGFNNDTACREYSQKLQVMGQELGVEINLADAMVTDEAGAARFIEAAKAQRPDALMILPMGIFNPWARAEKIFAALDLPTLVFTQIGTSFSMNTAPVAHKPGFHLTSSLNIADARGGLELVKAAASLKQSTLLVVGRNDYQRTVFEGNVFGPVGTKLKFIPGEDYVKCYKDVPVDDAVRKLADETIQRAKEVKEVTRDDVLQAARHYFASKRLLAEHGADGLTTVCLHLCNQVGTPCIGFMRLMDEGIVAGCEADIGSAVTMMLAHNLLGQSGFMADPFVDTAQNLFGNAHCNCPTRLDGFQKPPAEYILRSHHAGRHWVSPQVLWRPGQVFTLARFQRPDMLLVDRAKVVCNYDSPPSAACITNTGAIVEGAEDDPHKVAGFHVLQIYGDHVRKLRDFCQLYRIEAVHSWDPRVSFDFEPNCA
ncbi:MAG: twin-arginine translocation signal domain-containing protein [Verrucomicrobia bacterium]|nr:twin-arginine translocation signal domain-containing protein [Verrucomicrobiota bacterium]